ncbi:LptA/OstA family protein [Novosphingobium decolorationis]|uniref:OstA family protein n=1 Tax=Novosphingobium decolorationis TaxID=2698673 RepID=A0ABX8E5A8_9SPHN|nr:LptA/OstA family protein [Novosphingobium decolorationis]QVM84375.1 OstA family protein [Novosphingobium decolorationis]
MTSVRLPSLALRSALALALLATGGLVASQRIGAQALEGHNTDAPVDFSADKIELQDREDRVVLTGNVDIRQAGLTLKAARTVVNFTNADRLEVQRITATGGVRVTRRDEVATGDVAVYDFNKRIITMVGNASLKRGSTDTLRGGRFVVDLKTGVSSASGGRVKGTFNVPKSSN